MIWKDFWFETECCLNKTCLFSFIENMIKKFVKNAIIYFNFSFLVGKKYQVKKISKNNIITESHLHLHIKVY